MTIPAHCPFCDEDMPYLTPKKVLGKDGWVMFCGRCGAYGPWAETGDEAEKLWNTRDNKRCDICHNICKGGGYLDMNSHVRRCVRCHQRWVGKL